MNKETYTFFVNLAQALVGISGGVIISILAILIFFPIISAEDIVINNTINNTIIINNTINNTYIINNTIYTNYTYYYNASNYTVLNVTNITYVNNTYLVNGSENYYNKSDVDVKFNILKDNFENYVTKNNISSYINNTVSPNWRPTDFYLSFGIIFGIVLGIAAIVIALRGGFD